MAFKAELPQTMWYLNEVIGFVNLKMHITGNLHFSEWRGVLSPMSAVSISAAQIRGARAMLGLDQEELADQAGVTRKTLAGLESDESQAFASTRTKVRLALEMLGIQFIELNGNKGIVLKSQ